MIFITNKNLEIILSNNITYIFQVKKYRLLHLQKLLLPWALVLLAKKTIQCITTNTISSKPHMFDTRVNIISFLESTTVSNYFPFWRSWQFLLSYEFLENSWIMWESLHEEMQCWKIIRILSNHLIVALGYQARIQTLLHSDFDYKQKIERMLSNNITYIFKVKKYRLCHLQKLLLPWAVVLLAKKNNQCILSNTIWSKPHMFDTRLNVIIFL